MAIEIGTFRMQSISQALSDAWNWWRTELSRLVPPEQLQRLSRDAMELDLHQGPDGNGLWLTTANSTQPVSPADLTRTRRLWGPLVSVALTVPLSKCLVREVRLPKAAAARADEILRIDMERTMPFRAADVFSGCYRPDEVATGDNVLVHQIILKRSVIGASIDAIAAAGLPLNAILVSNDAGQLPVNLLQPAQRQTASATRWTWTLLVATAMLTAMLWATGVALTVNNLTANIEAADRELKKVSAQAQANRKQITETETMAALLQRPRLRKLSGAPLVALWNEVSRVLPEGTWISDFRVDDGMLQLDGQSTNASELIGLLAQSAMFTNVTFASPVVRDPQRGLERFQIKTQVKRLDLTGARSEPAVAK